MSAMTAMRILYPQLVWLPSNAAPEGDANQHGNKLRATNENKTASRSGAGGSTTVCLNFCNVFANSLLPWRRRTRVPSRAGNRLRLQSLSWFPCAATPRHAFRQVLKPLQVPRYRLVPGQAGGQCVALMSVRTTPPVPTSASIARSADR